MNIAIILMRADLVHFVLRWHLQDHRGLAIIAISSIVEPMSSSIQRLRPQILNYCIMPRSGGGWGEEWCAI
jgi:hypothetical protein